MKKYLFFGMIGAMALTFNACSSDEDVVNPNPTFDGESVKTTFTISVGDVTGGTRMAGTAVQQDESFKGMTDIYLFPAKAAIDGSTVTSESYIKLPDFNAFSTEVATAQGKIYKDVSFSVGVSNFLFYAAIDGGAKGNGELKASYLEMGKDVFHGENDWAPEPMLTTSTVNDIHFDLVPIQKDKVLDDVKEAGASTIKPLNDVYAAIVAQVAAATTANDAAAKAELEEIQTTLQNLVGTEYKAYAGSSLSQKALMTSLYTTVKNMDAILGTYGSAITDAIEESFDVTGDADAGFTLTWKTDPQFPSTVLGVPDGAAAVQYIAADNKFDFVQPSVDGMEVPEISKYTYPARLYYTINTPAMVKDAEYLSTLNNEYTYWKEVKENGEYEESPITASTRSVIMKDQVQYGVGRLDVAVRVKPETTIEDSGIEIDGSLVPQPVTVPGNGYKLTGVLIGNQKGVDWKFEPIATADEVTIWDNTMAEDIYAKQQEAYSAYNHTLALETPAATADADPAATVKIALEFENTGNDFRGVDNNVIPAGTKFYLVANLDPSKNTTAYKQDPENTTNEPNDTWENTTELIKQVFLQDYVTTVDLTIGANSLKHAYNVVPDLRSPKLEFGLSVDLHWREGIKFETEFE